MLVISLFMKYTYLALGAALLLTACNQTAPVTSTPTAPAAPAAEAPVAAPTAAPDSVPAAAAPTPAATATAPSTASAVQGNQTLQVSFEFKPAPDADNPARPRTSARLLMKGPKPQDIDLGKFAGKPDVVDAAKAKAANFPSGMLMGFRSYEPSLGIFSDLAVLKVDARHLRIVQRRVDETNPDAGKFETSREIPLGANTTIVVTSVTQK